MKPTQKTTEAEYKVIRWFLTIFTLITVLYLGYCWWQRTQECQTKCIEHQSSDGVLHFKGGGRFNLGTYCECADPK